MAMGLPVVTIFVFATITCGVAAPMNVRLLTNVPSPQRVGTLIGLAAHVENVAKGMLVFRYSVGTPGGPLHIIRDFSQQKDFVWRPPLYERQSTIHVTVRNNETEETADDEQMFRTVSRIQNPAPVVTPTANPLIALVSAPECPIGDQFRVAFRSEGTVRLGYTPFETCRGTTSSNVYVAGMRADSDYRLRTEVVNGKDITMGSWMAFHTGVLDGDSPPVSIAVERAAGSRATEPVLILSVASAGGPKRPLATGLDGPDYLPRH